MRKWVESTGGEWKLFGKRLEDKLVEQGGGKESEEGEGEDKEKGQEVEKREEAGPSAPP